MGKQLQALKRVIRAIPAATYEGTLAASKTSAKAKFGLTFLERLRKA